MGFSPDKHIYLIYFSLSTTQRKVTKEKSPLMLTPLSLRDIP
ncbi:MAG: hypothetical protein PWQ43_1583, partial [Rikenellaceae bacterium]|nr:hypothetical protein [Rikenellaceae bacterium]MDN5356639.1 hypothetical protein [Rikenellaceae bacterium]